MAIRQLSEEQIRDWTREQKDRWWLENVYRGDMPQLTARSAATGFLLGGILAATALYIAGKTGITIGVGLTSVILAFAAYRGLSKAGIARDFTILENNCTQSIATAAGYMVSPLISALAAYMLVTNTVIPAFHMIAWMVVCSLIGVLLAFPLKRRFINEEQLPFPEGRAAGVVLDALYTGAAATGMFKARLLGITAAIAGTYQLLTSDGWMKLLQFNRGISTSASTATTTPPPRTFRESSAPTFASSACVSRSIWPCGASAGSWASRWRRAASWAWSSTSWCWRPS